MSEELNRGGLVAFEFNPWKRSYEIEETSFVSLYAQTRPVNMHERSEIMLFRATTLQ